MPTIVVGGALANKPFNGGEAWVRLSWVLGFKRLGCDVYFMEQIAPSRCVDSAGQMTPFEASINAAYFREVTARFGLAQSAALICGDGDAVCGLPAGDLLDIAGAADLLVNISGNLRWPELRRRIRRTAYIDIDPGFTQYWHAASAGGEDALGLRQHDVHFTIGENIGTPASPVPTSDLRWRPTRQPVVLEDWPVTDGEAGRFTTVSSWRGPYGPVEWAGKTFGLKHHEFRKFAALPRSVPQSCELAVNIDPADRRDRAMLAEHGWEVVDPAVVASHPDTFRHYLQTSGAEFSVAQGIYVEAETGWFSDRTVKYLASGKPVLVQETGFSRNYPTGDGLVPFRTLQEAIDGAADIARRYDHHRRAARQLAAEHFDSDVVLGRLLDDALTGVTNH